LLSDLASDVLVRESMEHSEIPRDVRAFELQLPNMVRRHQLSNAIREDLRELRVPNSVLPLNLL
jgi:hypothetical protein